MMAMKEEEAAIRMDAGGKGDGGATLARTSTLSQEVESENESHLRQAILFDEDFLQPLLNVAKLVAENAEPSDAQGDGVEQLQLVWSLALDVLADVLCRWKNLPKKSVDIQDWVGLLRLAATRLGGGPAEVDSSDSEDEAVAAVAAAHGWQRLVQWLVREGGWQQQLEQWVVLLGPDSAKNIDGPLRLSLCELLREAQEKVAETDDADGFDDLDIGGGDTVGGLLHDQICALGVGGRIGERRSKKLSSGEHCP